MKVIILLVAALAVASARPQGPASIIKYVVNNLGFGGYNFDVEQSDGTKRQEQAEIINEGREDESIAVKGSYEYVGPDGKTYTVNYTADENGFQPEGEHLPPSAGVKKPQLQIPSAALASLAGK